MKAVSELLKQYYLLGSEPYYRTLYLKTNKHQQQLFILLHDIIFSILHSSDDANVRLQKIQWWAQECKNSLLESTPCSKRIAKHPITKALKNLHINDDAFMAFLNDVSQLSQSKKVSENIASNVFGWLINALAKSENIPLKAKTSQQLSAVLYNYQALNNIAIDFSFGYKNTRRLPKYLNNGHLTGNNPQVINDYIMQECEIIKQNLHALKGQKLPQVFITQLLFIQSVLKKIKKQPQSIYNNKQHLSPLKQLFISYFSKNKQVF